VSLPAERRDLSHLNLGAARFYTELVPTIRPRHTITETPPVHEAAQQAGEELADWIRNGNPGMVDIVAADEVKHLGLIANYDYE
jgi:hypothetical protein